MNLFDKNRTREKFTFANINLLGRCNADCFFCLGKEVPGIDGRNYTKVHFSKWSNFDRFVDALKLHNIEKVYVTGQNTDSLLYVHLPEFVSYLQDDVGVGVGLRTNGFKAQKKLDVVNSCKLECGYSIHTLKQDVQRSLMNRNFVPDWDYLLSHTERSRVAMVITQFNVHEFFDVVRFTKNYANVQHFQARRVSSDFRQEEMLKHVQEYEKLHKFVESSHPLIREFYGAPIYDIDGVEVTFWRTVQTTVNSINYFTDGTLSDEYFVVEGYMKNRECNLT